MSEIRVFALKYITQGGIVYPVDKRLEKLAVEFAETYLSEKINFTDYEGVLVACEIDDNGMPVTVQGMNCRVVRYDFPVCRFLTDQAADALIVRTRAYLDDQGLRGAEVFIHVADHEDKESRCPHWKRFLKKLKAVKASRWRVQV